MADITGRITETITFHFDDEEQQKRFHEILDNGSPPLAASVSSLREALAPICGKTNFIRKHDGDEIPDSHFFGGGLTWGDIRALRRAYENAFPPPDDETAWLIERSTECGPCWWGQDDGEHAWTHDHMQARRYCTKEDAEREASDMGLDDWFVCEHAWVSDRARAALSGVTQPATSTAANDVLAERERQKAVEGCTPEHDDTHTNFEMGRAAACYAYFATLPDDVREVASLGGSSAIDQVVVLRRMWRWHQDWWKPKDRRRDLVRAGALILAEIERLDRAEVEKISTDTGEVV